MAHGENVASTATGASDASPTRLPAWLSPAQYARLAGCCARTVGYLIERGEMPAPCIIYVGRSKHHRHVRLLTAKLIEHGWLLPDAVMP